MKFLKMFPKNEDGMYIVYELFTFDNMFRLLLKEGLDHEYVLEFIYNNCDLSGYVLQDRIYNKKYRKIDVKDCLPPELSASRARLIYDILSFCKTSKNS